VIDENRSWNELYLMRAFLMYNNAFEIVFFNDFFAKRFGADAKAAAPSFLLNSGGGLWLRKCGATQVSAAYTENEQTLSNPESVLQRSSVMDLNDQELIPDDDMIREHSGGIDRQRFITMGDEIVQHSLIGAAKLLPFHKFLDVGCGCGKLARPLTKYLNSEGRYDGIDITRAVVDWCKKKYQKHPNIHFHYADLYSSRYNPQGAYKASNYQFPFQDDEFDVVFLGSVFTHLVPEDSDNYLRELERVMKPGAVCLATFFVLDDESRANAKAGVTSPKFSYEFGREGCRIEVEDTPEAAIAYEELFLRGLYAKHGLTIDRICHGEWGRGRLIPHWQDEVWSTKPS
jgi:ubiquinone/menaquinone biosynthesis C-methylase UbiE